MMSRYCNSMVSREEAERIREREKKRQRNIKFITELFRKWEKTQKRS